ncbi:MAG TPA: GNAT family protein [Saprospiraceae bacterium]|nr:GNAT family protein [Saprospiraceae bacterium]
MVYNKLSVREIQKEDIPLIVNYWMNADEKFLLGMGVDLTKIPTKKDFINFLSGQLALPIIGKQSFCMIWLLDEKPVGHSNINKIIYGQEAFMHLHIWDSNIRNMGHGIKWINLTIPHFFKNYKLKDLYCEPYALNPAPNKTMQRAGFEFVSSYITIPGSLNFEQEVNLWRKGFNSI